MNFKASCLNDKLLTFTFPATLFFGKVFTLMLVPASTTDFVLDSSTSISFNLFTTSLIVEAAVLV